MTDGYGGYEKVVKAEGLVHLGCWAHVRRKFEDALRVQGKGKTGRAAKRLHATMCCAGNERKRLE